MDPKAREDRAALRFWSRVNKRADDECWIWTGATNKYGYGYMYYNGGSIQAHRFSMQLALGRKLEKSSRQLIGKTLVLHTCDTPACVNPAHLYLGNQAQNIKDRDKRNRQSKGTHRYNSKLNAEKVREIRRLYDGGMSTNKIADIMGVNSKTVWVVAKRKGWVHVA